MEAPKYGMLADALRQKIQGARGRRTNGSRPKRNWPAGGAAAAPTSAGSARTAFRPGREEVSEKLPWAR